MTYHISYTTYDHLPADLVPVIASFDTAGHVRPLYVRIEGETLKIHSSRLRSSSSGVMIYECNVKDGDCLKPITLTYHLKEKVWSIPKK